MEDSDEEIFFGPITDHEKLVASKICRDTLTPLKRRSTSFCGVDSSGDSPFGVLNTGKRFGESRRRLSFEDEDTKQNTNLQTNDVEIAALCHNMRTCCRIDSPATTKSESTFACGPSLPSNRSDNPVIEESVSSRGTKFRTPRPPIKHMQRSVKSKVGHYSNIVSPVAAYIKNAPLPPLITTKRSGESWTDKSPKSLNAISNLKFGMCSPFRRQNLNAPLPSLPVVAYEKVPVVAYEKVPVVNANNPGLVMHHPPLKSQPSTPKVTKHAGRAILSSLHQRPTPVENNSEVSVIYPKEVAKTSTLQ